MWNIQPRAGICSVPSTRKRLLLLKAAGITASPPAEGWLELNYQRLFSPYLQLGKDWMWCETGLCFLSFLPSAEKESVFRLSCHLSKRTKCLKSHSLNVSLFLLRRRKEEYRCLKGRRTEGCNWNVALLIQKQKPETSYLFWRNVKEEDVCGWKCGGGAQLWKPARRKRNLLSAPIYRPLRFKSSFLSTLAHFSPVGLVWAYSGIVTIKVHCRTEGWTLTSPWLKKKHTVVTIPPRLLLLQRRPKQKWIQKDEMRR